MAIVYFFSEMVRLRYKTDLSILAGSSIAGKGDEYRTRSVFKHPQYDQPRVDYDVAVISIEGQFDAYNNQRPIPLSKHTDIESLVGLDCLVTGFGRTSVS